MGEVSQEEIRAATERYPGIPVPLAVAKYMADRQLENEPISLKPGLGWGGIHLERVGQLVQKMADAMYEQGKKGMTISIEAIDFPESWDHISIAIKDVDSGTDEEIASMGLAGWPCCCCDETIKGTDRQAAIIMLHKRAKWDYPSWGNVLDGTSGMASASVCGQCLKEEREILYAVKKNGNTFVRVPVAELEDAYE